MGLFAGPFAALRGLQLLLKHPTLVKLSLLPALLASVLSAIGVWAAIAYGPDLLSTILTEPENTILYVFWWILALLVRISAAALSLIVTPWLVMFLGLPICEPLAAKADELLGGKPVEGSFVAEVVLAFTGSIGILGIGLAGTVVLFLLGLIPGLGAITAPFALLIWTPLFLAFDMCEASLTRRQFNLRQKLSLLSRNPLRTLSLGLTATVLVAVPVLNLVGLPIAVLAGVFVVRDMERA